ncbi:MAG TPA: DUF4339 domain-containing protein [Fimbriimonadaceae bacterium]|nr:DUF4339 domain-containing protein [Fimbriimonadaceae bacterium]
MDYLVTAADGKEYGPVTFEELRQWVLQDRVRHDTPVKNFHTGQAIAAGAIPGLFSSVPPPPAAGTDWSQPPAPPAAYPRNYSPSGYAPRMTDDGKGVLIGVIARCALGILLFFLLHGIGLIVSGYAVVYAIQSKANGHKFGIASLIIASVTFLVILVGWIIRLQGGGGF